MKNDTFGINMKQYCREHEKKVRAAAAEENITADLLNLHREKIAILQHERLVHLIVTVMVVIAELFTVNLVLLHPEAAGISGAAVMLGLAVLLGFYFCHYFFLENTVQRWYRLLDEIRIIACRNSESDSGEPGEGDKRCDYSGDRGLVLREK